MIQELLRSLRYTEEWQSSRAAELEGLENYYLRTSVRESGKTYYSVRKRGTRDTHYLGDASSEEVKKIKEAHFLQKSLRIIRNDIKLVEEALDGLKEFDYDSVNLNMPKVYMDATVVPGQRYSLKASRWKEAAERRKQSMPQFHPEDCKVRTKDGSLVRSKSEAIIYNQLLDLGVTFVYEMPMKVGDKILHPDFTILSEIDYTTEIIIEHQGKMNDDTYRQFFFSKLTRYWNAGWLQGINIFYTFDAPDGGLDITPILDIVKTRIRPGI